MSRLQTNMGRTSGICVNQFVRQAGSRVIHAESLQFAGPIFDFTIVNIRHSQESSRWSPQWEGFCVLDSPWMEPEVSHGSKIAEQWCYIFHSTTCSWVVDGYNRVCVLKSYFFATRYDPSWLPNKPWWYTPCWHGELRPMVDDIRRTPVIRSARFRLWENFRGYVSFHNLSERLIL